MGLLKSLFVQASSTDPYPLTGHRVTMVRVPAWWALSANPVPTVALSEFNASSFAFHEAMYRSMSAVTAKPISVRSV